MMENTHKQIAWDSIVCLIVDDDKFSRTFTKTALYQIGIKNTKEANTTKEAIELMRSFKIDVILLDQQMPEQTGLDFAKEIKAGSFKIHRFRRGIAGGGSQKANASDKFIIITLDSGIVCHIYIVAAGTVVQILIDEDT